MLQDFFLAHGEHTFTGHWIFMVIIWMAVFAAVWILFLTLAGRIKKISQTNYHDKRGDW